MEYKKVVFSILGIRTRVKWRKYLNKAFSGKYITISFGYSFLSVIKLIIKPFRNKVIDWFYKGYIQAVSDQKLQFDLNNYRKRPSIIAYGFGSYIVVKSMLKYEDIKFDKIILCGSILPGNFDWSEILRRDQVDIVKNEYGKTDFWTKIISAFISDTGSSGLQGFKYFSHRIKQQRFLYTKLNDYFSEKHFKNYWLKTIEKAPEIYQVVHGRDIDSLEKIKEFFKETSLIDNEVFGILPNYSEIEASIEQSVQWVEINPDIHTFLINKENNSIAGYISAIPINNDTFDQICKGSMQDKQFFKEHVLTFKESNEINIYIMSIALSNKERLYEQNLIQSTFEMLIQGFMEKLFYYAINYQIKVKNLVAIGWTKEGIKLCHNFGMKETGKDIYNNPIFVIDTQKDNGELNTKMKLWTDSLKKVYNAIG